MPKYEEVNLKLADAVSEAFAEVTDLAESMREAYDNTPESLQQSAIGEARDEAANILEGINEVDVPDELAQFEVSYNKPARTNKQQMKLSRSARRDDACMILDAVIQKLDEVADDEKESEAVRDSATELRDELDNAKSELEGVEFPGRNV